jgi:hypothetical protein
MTQLILLPEFILLWISAQPFRLQFLHQLEFREYATSETACEDCSAEGAGGRVESDEGSAGDEAADLGEDFRGTRGGVVEDFGAAHAVAHDEEGDGGGEEGVEHAGYVGEDAGGGTCETAVMFLGD